MSRLLDFWRIYTLTSRMASSYLSSVSPSISPATKLQSLLISLNMRPVYHLTARAMPWDSSSCTIFKSIIVYTESQTLHFRLLISVYWSALMAGFSFREPCKSQLVSSESTEVLVGHKNNLRCPTYDNVFNRSRATEAKTMIRVKTL